MGGWERGQQLIPAGGNSGYSDELVGRVLLAQVFGDELDDDVLFVEANVL